MNKHLHRIVFNAARGLRMVVQESARSTGKGASGATSAAVSVGLFNYTDADRRLDDLNAIDPRNAGGLNAQERRSTEQNIQACRDAPSCIEDVNRRYDRMVSDRSETVMTTVNAIRAYNNCAAGDTACVSVSLAQMKTLQADLKAKGMTLADTERIGLNSYIASAEASLGNSYGALSAMAMGATGAKGSEAGNGTFAATLPLGRGSTGRTVPSSLSEQLAMAQVISSPGAGTVVPLRNGMTDSRWPASEGWVKMAQNINGVEIHYVRNISSGAVDDFKFNK